MGFEAAPRRRHPPPPPPPSWLCARSPPSTRLSPAHLSTRPASRSFSCKSTALCCSGDSTRPSSSPPARSYGRRWYNPLRRGRVPPEDRPAPEIVRRWIEADQPLAAQSMPFSEILGQLLLFLLRRALQARALTSQIAAVSSDCLNHCLAAERGCKWRNDLFSASPPWCGWERYAESEIDSCSLNVEKLGHVSPRVVCDNAEFQMILLIAQVVVSTKQSSLISQSSILEWYIGRL